MAIGMQTGAPLLERYMLRLAAGYDFGRRATLESIVCENERWAIFVLNNTNLARLVCLDGEPLLFKAVSRHERIAEMALANPALARITDDQGISVAHVAVVHHKRMAQRLLEQWSPLLKLKTRMGVSVKMFAKMSLGLC
jgi:hypothetical protein